MKLSKLRASNSHRMVAGTKVPKAGHHGFAMKRASGGACESVEGEKPKMRLDRPMRAKGGRVDKMESKASAKDKHDDEEEDRKLVHEMVKPSAMRARGGPLKLDLKKGALKKELRVPEGEKIPEKKLEKAEHSDNPKLKKRAVLAENMRHWDHKKG